MRSGGERGNLPITLGITLYNIKHNAIKTYLNPKLIKTLKKTDAFYEMLLFNQHYFPATV